MSWRRFIILLKNLPANSTVIRRLMQEREDVATGTSEIDPKEAAEQFFTDMGV